MSLPWIKVDRRRLAHGIRHNRWTKAQPIPEALAFAEVSYLVFVDEFRDEGLRALQRRWGFKSTGKVERLFRDWLDDVATWPEGLALIDPTTLPPWAHRVLVKMVDGTKSDSSGTKPDSSGTTPDTTPEQKQEPASPDGTKPDSSGTEPDSSGTPRTRAILNGRYR